MTIAGSGTVDVARAALDGVVAHARDAAPAECCGLLVGRGDRIVAAVQTRNIAEPATTRFLIDPKDHIDGRREARQRGLDIVGFYHSHPRSAPVPSAIDVADAAYPQHLYLIVGLGTDPPECALYRFSGGAFVSVGMSSLQNL